MSDSGPHTSPEATGGTSEREPYPKLIIACIIIAAVFFVIVLAALGLEFITNATDTSPKPPDLLIPSVSAAPPTGQPQHVLHTELAQVVATVNPMNAMPKV